MRVPGACVLLLVCCAAAPAAAEFPLWSDFEEGRWRVEVSDTAGIHTGKTDREGDWLLTGSLEYEWPVMAHGSLGLRIYPLFYLSEDEDDGDSDSIWGGGGGPVLRLYHHEDTQTGFYLEAGASLIWMSDHIEKNSSRVNFLTGIGLGYQFGESGWHAIAKWEHISNAGTGDRNTGYNGLGVGVGYRF